MSFDSNQLAASLEQRKQNNLYRSRQTLDGPQGVSVSIDGQRYLSFCSNDYLGLANHPQLIAAVKEGLDRFGVGSGAAHLITGHSYAHQALEEDLAEFVGQPRALLFSTGYMANLGVVSALLGRKDAVFEDRLNHASLLDAAKLSGAQLHRYRHNEVLSLAEKLDGASTGKKLIACDAVFSMDGDQAPLSLLKTQADKHQSWLLVDDAHGFGVLGAQGRGCFASQFDHNADNAILMATFGKALGCFGAFVAGSDDLIETLIQNARPYIYTTATPPALAWATRTALKLVEHGEDRRQHLQQLINQFREGAEQLGLQLMDSNTPIQPLAIGSAENTVRISETLRKRGLLVTAIRPPTVPEGSSRLRITFSAEHTGEQVDRLLESLNDCNRELATNS